MKRDALIGCLEAAKHLHSKQWAQTSIEIAYEVNRIKYAQTAVSEIV